VDAESSPTSRVVAAVPAGGATWAAIAHRTGMGSDLVDAGLLGALRARLLIKSGKVFYPAHVRPRFNPQLGPRTATAPKPAHSRWRSRRTEERATAPKPAHSRWRSRRTEERAKARAERERLKAELCNVCAELREQGMNLTDIARKLGVSRTTARTAARKGRGMRAVAT